jgi:hypothetical protein
MSLLSFFVSLAALMTTALLLPSLTFVCASRTGLESGPWRRDWPSSDGANGLKRILAFEANHRPRRANAGQLRTHAEKSLNGRRIRLAALAQSRRTQLLAATGSNANELVGFGNLKILCLQKTPSLMIFHGALPCLHSGSSASRIKRCLGHTFLSRWINRYGVTLATVAIPSRK